MLPASRFARYAVAASVTVITAAVALFGYGLFAGDLDIKMRLASLILGVLLLFIGVALVASRLVRPLAFLLGAGLLVLNVKGRVK